jgi:hypothetical protein
MTDVRPRVFFGMDQPSSDDQQIHRQHLVQARENASRDYDKALLTLAAGALVISIAFIHNIAPHPKDIGFVIATWILFSVSLVSIVTSLLTSQRELLAAINRHDKGIPDVRPESKSPTNLLSIIAGVTFLMGVVGLVVFALLNLNRV